jgi:hypothetical protein
MRKLWLFILLIILAADASSQTLSTSDMEEIKTDISNFLEKNTEIIMGSGLSLTEKAFFNVILKQSGLELLVLEDGVNLPDRSVALIGGEKTNSLYSAATTGEPTSDVTKEYGPLKIRYLQYTDKKILAAWTVREEENFQVTGIAKSPFAGILPTPLIPVAASLVSVLFLLFLKFLAGTATGIGKTIISVTAGSHWKKRYDEGEAKHHVKFHVIEMPSREILTIALVILVLTAAKSWAYSPPWWEVFQVVLITTAIVTIYRELLRIFFAKRRSVHVESVFWPAGAVLTLFSAWMGSMFSLPNYVRIRKDESKQWAVIGLYVTLSTMLLSFSAWLINWFWPNHYVQVISVLSATIAFMSLVPIAPLAGANIYKHSKKKWAFAFMLAFPLYIIVVFLSQYIL